MERRSEGSRQFTIRDKIWTLTVVLTVTNAVVGSAVVVVGSVFAASWMPAAAALCIVTIITVGFAPVFSREILKPLEKVNLLAKGIERNPGMSVPATTGAVETDDLLHTVSRASRQLTNFVELMNDVSAGKTQAALQPFEHSDRLSESFQRLVAKVTDSIDAKAKLDRLERAVEQISTDLSGLDRGEAIRIRTEFEGTQRITDALRSLLDQRSENLHVIAASSSDLRTMISEGKSRVSAAIEKEAALARSLKKAVNAVTEAQTGSQASVREHAALLGRLTALFDELKNDPLTEDKRSKSRLAIQRQFDTAINKLRDVGEQSLAITHVAKAVQDLAKRSNMIALNASIHMNADDRACLETLTQEIASLSGRAEKANRAIAGISDSVVRDVNEANASLHWVSTEVGRIIARTEMTEEAIARTIDTLKTIHDLKEKVDGQLADWAIKEDAGLEQLDDCLNRCSEISNELRTCEYSFEMVQEPLAQLRGLVASRNRSFPLSEYSENGKQQSSFGIDDATASVMSGELLAVAEENS